MDLKTFLLRFMALAAFTVGGGLLYALTINALIALGVTPESETQAQLYGQAVTQATVTVFLFSILTGFAGIFIKDSNWRWPVHACPLYASALFAILFTIIRY